MKIESSPLKNGTEKTAEIKKFPLKLLEKLIDDMERIAELGLGNQLESTYEINASVDKILEIIRDLPADRIKAEVLPLLEKAMDRESAVWQRFSSLKRAALAN